MGFGKAGTRPPVLACRMMRAQAFAFLLLACAASCGGENKSSTDGGNAVDLAHGAGGSGGSGGGGGSGGSGGSPRPGPRAHPQTRHFQGNPRGPKTNNHYIVNKLGPLPEAPAAPPPAAGATLPPRPQ